MPKHDPEMLAKVMPLFDTLVKTGITPFGAAKRIEKLTGIARNTILSRRDKAAAEVAPVKRKAAKCLYCGQPYNKWSGQMIPIVDWRGQAVWAHVRCERLEQMVAGAL